MCLLISQIIGAVYAENTWPVGLTPTPHPREMNTCAKTEK